MSPSYVDVTVRRGSAKRSSALRAREVGHATGVVVPEGPYGLTGSRDARSRTGTRRTAQPPRGGPPARGVVWRPHGEGRSGRAGPSVGVALWAPISTPPPQPPRARTSPTWRGGPRPRGQPPAGAPDVPGGDVQRRRHPGGPHHGQGLAQEVAVPVVKGQGDQRVGGPPSAPPHVGELADGDRAEAGFPDSLDLLGETGWWHGEVREAAARPSRNAVVHEDRHRSPRGGGGRSELLHVVSAHPAPRFRRRPVHCCGAVAAAGERR